MSYVTSVSSFQSEAKKLPQGLLPKTHLAIYQKERPLAPIILNIIAYVALTALALGLVGLGGWAVYRHLSQGLGQRVLPLAIRLGALACIGAIAAKLLIDNSRILHRIKADRKEMAKNEEAYFANFRQLDLKYLEAKKEQIEKGIAFLKGEKAQQDENSEIEVIE